MAFGKMGDRIPCFPVWSLQGLYLTSWGCGRRLVYDKCNGGQRGFLGSLGTDELEEFLASVAEVRLRVLVPYPRATRAGA
jgi:hypothetical protein